MDFHSAAICALNSNKAKSNETIWEEEKEKIIHRMCREHKDIFTTVKFTRSRTTFWSSVQLVQLVFKLARFKCSQKSQ